MKIEYNLKEMGDSNSKDLACKSFFSQDERFADLLNGGFYRGQQKIKSHELRELDTELGVQVKGNSIWRRRDLIKAHHKESVLDLVGVEFQSTVDLIMPLRTMVYDALTYQKVYDLYNRICPVKTMCLYTGDKRWNGPKTLHKMMGLDQEKSEYVPDYPIHVVDLKEVDVQWFHNDDVRQLIQLFQLLNQMKDVEECVMKLKELKITSEDAVRTAGILAGADLYECILKEKEGGKFMACQNIERIYNEIMEKRCPELIEEKKRAEEKSRQEEEKRRQAEEKSRQEEEKRCQAEEKSRQEEEKRCQAEEKGRQEEKKRRQAEEKINRTVKKLLQAGESVDYVSELTGMSVEEILALMEA